MRILRLLALLVAALAPVAGRAAVELASRIADAPWRRTAAVEARAGEPVALRVKAPPGAAIRWYRIVPDDAAPYQNAVWPWDPHPYQWLGFAKLRYAREELAAWRGRAEVTVAAGARDWRTAADAADGAPDGLGSYWFQVEVEAGGRVEASPGLERNDPRGLSPEVLRVTFRAGDDLLGQLTGWFHVPGVFGAVPYQVANYLGVDCADVLMAADARARGQPVVKDHNVAGLTRALPVVRTVRVTRGAPAARLRWGADVRPGDLLAVKYEGWSQFGHVGALYADANRNGVVDPEDLVLHAGPAALHFSTLGEGAFDGEVKVLRARAAGPDRAR
jgi:hypothetical protein